MTTILVVEDEPFVALDIEDSLRRLGYVVEVAASCDEALQAAARRRIDLALLDIRIRGTRDGIETAGLLKARFEMPVVFLTAYADDETIARAAAREPSGYLVKPFQDRELQGTIEAALYRHGADAARRRLAMESIAGEIAHTVNNPLAYVIACLRDLDRELAADNPELAQAIDDAREGAERIRRGVAELGAAQLLAIAAGRSKAGG